MNSNQLEEYFHRIEYTGPREVSVEVLSEILLLHAQSVAFENLNPFLRLPVPLDLDSIFNKIVKKNRGGYCFEQNILFSRALKQIGFNVRHLAARIMWNTPEGTITPRGHMLLLIDLNGEEYLADVGFGGLTMTGPLRLETNLIQETPHEKFRILSRKRSYILQSQIQHEWRSLYVFDRQEQFIQDYEVSSWYLSNHPESHFVTGLIAARPFPGGRYNLRNNQFSVHKLNGVTEKRTLESVSELKEILINAMQLTLPERGSLDEKLQELLTSVHPGK